MTATQMAKIRRSTPEFKAMVKATRAAMLDLKAKGLDFDHLAVCPDTYQLYLKVKHS
jgi:hypothetical protein